MLLSFSLPLALAQPPALCAADDPALGEALRAWVALDGALREGRPAEGVDDLLGHPCLALARAEVQVDLRWSDEGSLRRWWLDGGGRWLRSYLDPADFNLVFLPPDPRDALGPPDAPGAPDLLEGLRCAPEDPACAALTEGWAARAEASHEAHAALLDVEGRCAAERDLGYTAWRRCLGQQAGRGDALPLGHIRPPEAGWLVVRGPRGSLSDCQSVQAFDLATGAAWLGLSCPDRAPELRAGAVPAPRLRELAWALLLLGELREEVRTEGLAYPLPEGMERVWTGSVVPAPAPEQPLWSTQQSWLVWAWTPPPGQGPEVIAGYFAWPRSSSAGEDHVDALLAEVEAALAPGCPVARPPADTRAGRLHGEPPGLTLALAPGAEALRLPPPACVPSPPEPP